MSKMQHFGWVSPYPAAQAAKALVNPTVNYFLSPELCYQAYTSSHAVNDQAFFSTAKSVTLRESPVSLTKIMKTWALRKRQRRATSPQRPNVFLTSTDDHVDQSWKQASFPSLLFALFLFLTVKKGKQEKEERSFSCCDLQDGAGCVQTLADAWKPRLMPRSHVAYTMLVRNSVLSLTISNLKYL